MKTTEMYIASRVKGLQSCGGLAGMLVKLRGMLT